MRTILRHPQENDLRDQVCRDALRNFGVRSIQINLRNDAGWPDRLFLTPYWPTWLEFKRPGDKPRPLQMQRLEILTSLGYLHNPAEGWTDNYDAAMERLRNVLIDRKELTSHMKRLRERNA